ncbi:hypothetical protein HMPREF3291_06055 [Bacillus sp. HMSC76G11]|nr:hypothetical protein HMPREF3291_06055 [Bacillus sp. HMSC76G11]
MATPFFDSYSPSKKRKTAILHWPQAAAMKKSFDFIYSFYIHSFLILDIISEEIISLNPLSYFKIIQGNIIRFK